MRHQKIEMAIIFADGATATTVAVAAAKIAAKHFFKRVLWRSLSGFWISASTSSISILRLRGICQDVNREIEVEQAPCR